MVLPQYPGTSPNLVSNQWVSMLLNVSGFFHIFNWMQPTAIPKMLWEQQFVNILIFCWWHSVVGCCYPYQTCPKPLFTLLLCWTMTGLTMPPIHAQFIYANLLMFLIRNMPCKEGWLNLILALLLFCSQKVQLRSATGVGGVVCHYFRNVNPICVCPPPHPHMLIALYCPYLSRDFIMISAHWVCVNLGLISGLSVLLEFVFYSAPLDTCWWPELCVSGISRHLKTATVK